MFKIREGSPEGIRMTMEERIFERDEFYVWSERLREKFMFIYRLFVYYQYGTFYISYKTVYVTSYVLYIDHCDQGRLWPG